MLHHCFALAALVLASIKQLISHPLGCHEPQPVHILSTQLKARDAVVLKLRQLLHEGSKPRILAVWQFPIVPHEERLLQQLIPPLFGYRFVVIGGDLCVRQELQLHLPGIHLEQNLLRLGQRHFAQLTVFDDHRLSAFALALGECESEPQLVGPLVDAVVGVVCRVVVDSVLERWHD